MKSFLLNIVVWLFLGSSLFGASRPLHIEFQLSDKVYGADIKIEELRFYVSQVQLYNNEEIVFAQKQSFHLIEKEDSTRTGFILDIPDQIEFTHIQFSLGIDSTTNVSGVFGGALDPMHGMYWTWQSGYINFKLEGTSPVCPARHNRFQFHIGGYNYPYASIQSIRLKIKNTNQVKINFKLDPLFEEIDIEEEYAIMSPGRKAMIFSSHLPKLFTIAE